MKKILLLVLALMLSACGPTTLNGTYENPPNTFTGHFALNFKPDGSVIIKQFDKPIPSEEHQYKVVGEKIQIQNFVIPLTIFKDGSLDGNMFGVFKKK